MLSEDVLSLAYITLLVHFPIFPEIAVVCKVYFYSSYAQLQPTNTLYADTSNKITIGHLFDSLLVE